MFSTVAECSKRSKIAAASASSPASTSGQDPIAAVQCSIYAKEHSFNRATRERSSASNHQHHNASTRFAGNDQSSSVIVADRRVHSHRKPKTGSDPNEVHGIASPHLSGTSVPPAIFLGDLPFRDSSGRSIGASNRNRK